MTKLQLQLIAFLLIVLGVVNLRRAGIGASLRSNAIAISGRLSKRAFKRLVAAVGMSAALLSSATIVVGFTAARFSSSSAPSTASTFTEGTVAVGLDSAGTQVPCTIANLNPGDSSTNAPIGGHGRATCRYEVNYTGSVNAWLAVDMTIANGSPALYNGSTGGLQLYLSDASSTSYIASTATDAGGGAGTKYTSQAGISTTLPNTGIANLLVNASTGGSAPNTVVHFTLDYALPTSTPTTFQGSSVSVVLNFHAVQAGNNALPAACATGRQCTGVSWS